MPTGKMAVVGGGNASGRGLFCSSGFPSSLAPPPPFPVVRKGCGFRWENGRLLRVGAAGVGEWMPGRKRADVSGVLRSGSRGERPGVRGQKMKAA